MGQEYEDSLTPAPVSRSSVGLFWSLLAPEYTQSYSMFLAAPEALVDHPLPCQPDACKQLPTPSGFRQGSVTECIASSLGSDKPGNKRLSADHPGDGLKLAS